MALSHANPGEVVSLRPYGTALPDTVSVALFKSEQLEVVRLSFPAGKTMPSHKVNGPITIQCLEGEVDVSHPHAGSPSRLRAGDWLHLGGGDTHALTALRDTSVLVTIVLR